MSRPARGGNLDELRAVARDALVEKREAFDPETGRLRRDASTPLERLELFARTFDMAACLDLLDAVEAARVAFDVATSSMDFGSGFLDLEEVVGLRRLARALGVDPVEATPPGYPATVGEVPATRGRRLPPLRQCPGCAWVVEDVVREAESKTRIEENEHEEV